MTVRHEPAGTLRQGIAGALCALALAIVSQNMLAARDSGQVDEYQVKAAFLFNFVRFVDWPATAFDGPASPIVIGIVGDDPFGDEIDRLIENRTVNGRGLQVRHFHDLKSLGKSHVLFVAGSDKRTAAKVLDAVRNSPVMTVGESDGFAQAGGVCNFTRDGAKVSFEINVNAAGRAGLTLSSRLLALARIVREDGVPSTSR